MKTKQFDIRVQSEPVPAIVNAQLAALLKARDALSPVSKEGKVAGAVMSTTIEHIRGLRRQRKATKISVQVSRVLYGRKFEMTQSLSTYSERHTVTRSLMSKVNESIRTYRKARQSYTNNHSFREYNVTVPKLGECYTEPGTFAKLFKRKQRLGIFKAKRPETEHGYVGIEIEFASTIDLEAVADSLYDAGLASYVCVKRDGSIKVIDSHPYQIEVAVLASEYEISSIIRRVCAVINPIARVNPSCGLHVHLDMRHRPYTLAYNNLVAMQHFLYAMNPISRKKSQYCKPNASKQWHKKSGDRYHAINADAYRKFNTLECRVHSGTTDPTKITHWVNLLIAIAGAEEIKRAPTTIKGFQKALNVSGELLQYVQARIEKFKPEHNPTDNPEIPSVSDDENL